MSLPGTAGEIGVDAVVGCCAQRPVESRRLAKIARKRVRERGTGVSPGRGGGWEVYRHETLA
jgi:hypothetical protein